MFTQEERLLASKLYALIYNSANIYNAPQGLDPMIRFVNVVREMKNYMKEIECE